MTILKDYTRGAVHILQEMRDFDTEQKKSASLERMASASGTTQDTEGDR
jgi:hypothetical protein